MLLLEHDAKELLRGHGIAVPPGVLVESAGPAPFPGPWMVKAQVPTGGRGKAGGIRRASRGEELSRHLADILGLRIHGHEVGACRIEKVAAGREVYVALRVEPRDAGVQVLVSPLGGVGVEAAPEALLTGVAAPDEAALEAEIARLVAGLPGDLRAPVGDAAPSLARAFLALDALLIEINPLLVDDAGGWVAGDAKVILDDNALPRQEAVRELLTRRAAAYPEVVFKQDHGFDLVVLDPEGEIGLVTTGAGLSMQLVDELIVAGVRPYNFCDVRSGQMRGDPARLIGILGRIAEGPRVRAVLINIFAGITDLGEFAELLVTALRALPELEMPVVARLVGNGEERAVAILRTAGVRVVLEPDLDRAVALAVEAARAGPGDA
jgi:succinyl-CoA synthetase beta subunit